VHRSTPSGQLGMGLPTISIDQSIYGLERIASTANLSTHTWYLADGVGSVQATLDDAGTLLANPQYDAWGIPASPAPTPFGFTGEYTDGPSGLVYLRARWYDPTSGTLLGRDPFEGYTETPYSLHPYAYGYSDPVSMTDPSGHNPCDNYLPTYAVSPACIAWLDTAANALMQAGPHLISFGLDILPGVGDIKALIEIYTNCDLITGEPIGNMRWLGLLGVIGLGNEARSLGKAGRVLVLGEDALFEYSRSLARSNPDFLVVAGSYRTPPTFTESLDNFVHIPGDVDARALGSYPKINSNGPYDSIVFNNPFMTDRMGTVQLIEEFVGSSRQQLKPNGKVVVTINPKLGSHNDLQSLNTLAKIEPDQRVR